MSDPTPQCCASVHGGRRTWPKADYSVFYRQSEVTRQYCQNCWQDLEGCFNHRHVEVSKL